MLQDSVQILFNPNKRTIEEIKGAEAFLTNFENGPEFWSSSVDDLQKGKLNSLVCNYYLMALKRRLLFDWSKFNPTQKRQLFNILSSLEVGTESVDLKDQLLSRLYFLFFSNLNEDEKQNLSTNPKLLYYFLQEDLDKRIISWLNPVFKEQVLPLIFQNLASPQNNLEYRFYLPIIRLALEREISKLDQRQVEILLAISIKQNFPEDLFELLELLLEKCEFLVFVPFIRFFIDQTPLSKEFILFCLEWTSYVSSTTVDKENNKNEAQSFDIIDLLIKIIKAGTELYDPADSCFSPQFLLELSQLPDILNFLEEQIVFGCEHTFLKISKSREIESERRDGDFSILRSVLENFPKRASEYFQYYLGKGNYLMCEALIPILKQISTHILPNLINSYNFTTKQKIRLIYKLQNLLTDTTILHNFIVENFQKEPALFCKLLKNFKAGSIGIDVESLWDKMDFGNQNQLSNFISLLGSHLGYRQEIFGKILSYSKMNVLHLMTSYFEGMKAPINLDFENLITLYLDSPPSESEHIQKLFSVIGSKLDDKDSLILIDKIFSLPLTSTSLTVILDILNKHPGTFSDQMAQLLSSVPSSDEFDSILFGSPLSAKSFLDHLIGRFLSNSMYSDPSTILSFLKFAKQHSLYNSRIVHHLLQNYIGSIPVNVKVEVAEYIYHVYQVEPTEITGIFRTRSEKDTFRSERNFIEWFLLTKFQ
jgi:hypothetical protein